MDVSFSLCFLCCIAVAYWHVPVSAVKSQGKDSRNSANSVVSDVIDLDDVDSTGNDTLIDTGNGKIILESFPTNHFVSDDVISDDVDDGDHVFISGSGSDEEVNMTFPDKFTVLPVSETTKKTSVITTEESEVPNTTEEVAITTEATQNYDIEENSSVDDTDQIPNFDQLCEIKNCKYGGICVRTGEHSVGCACPASCGNDIGRRMCGSDGVVYSSQCHLQSQACKQQTNITEVDYKTCVSADRYCDESEEPTWSSWSIWLQSGSNDFRFRYCKIGDDVIDDHANCGNDRIEMRPCKRQDVLSCSSPFGEENNQFTYECSGTDIQDLTDLDQLFNGKLKEEVECKFSLYDVGLSRFVHSNWSFTSLKEKGDAVIWCNHRSIFVPFSTATKNCQEKLDKFCSDNADKETCKPAKRIRKNKGDMKHKCWKKFLLNEALPQGIANITNKYYICQRFAAETEYANIFGQKNTHFGTIYDTRARIPIMSFGRFNDMGDTMWPVVPYMIEKGLVKLDYSLFNVFFDQKRKGIVTKELKDEKDLCENGQNQAFLVDYKSSNYHQMHLLSPDIAGATVSKRIATFTLTNTAPMHVSLITAWKQAMQKIRKFATEYCRIPVSVNAGNQVKKRRQSHDTPEVYTISGAVPSTNPEVLLNNRVNVPYLMWVSACCVRGAEASSFSMYIRNDMGSPVVVAPVVQLEVLLGDLYTNKRENPVKLFPAYDGICSDIQNDVSQSIAV